MALAQPGSARREHGLAATARPVAPSNRLASIDIVRGIALFGVMAINVVTVFRVSIFEQFLPARTSLGFDRALQSILMVGVDLKAFALFSLLFGVGIAIQYDHLSASSRRTPLLFRRLAFLMIIGGIHLVFIWNGDILLEYAIAGFIVLPFLFGSTRLLTVAGVVLLAVFIAAPFLPPMAALPSRAWMTQHVAEAARIYSSGGLGEVLAFRIRELPAILPLHVFMFPRTVALVFLGAAAWRSGLLLKRSEPSQHLPLAAAVGVLVGGVLSVVLANGWFHLGWKVELSLDRFGAALLAIGYGASIIWAVDGARAGFLAWAAPVGRMAFTNYLMQSLIFGWIFYGYGLGLFGKLSVAAAFAIGVVVYALQAAFSAVWLHRYHFGPVEWLWRSAMYGKSQPFRLPESASG